MDGLQPIAAVEERTKWETSMSMQCQQRAPFLFFFAPSTFLRSQIGQSISQSCCGMWPALEGQPEIRCLLVDAGEMGN